MTSTEVETAIEFSALGLRFKATVLYTPPEEAITTGPADNWYAGAAPDLDFVTLTVDGNDAMFLLNAELNIHTQILNAALLSMTEDTSII